MESESNDIEVNRVTRWLFVSAVVLLVCGVLAIVLPLTFSLGVAGFLGWLFIFAALAHLIFGIHFGSGFLAWHALIAALYALAAISLLVNPLLGVVLLALVIGMVLIAEGIIETALFFALRDYRHAIWILIDGAVTLVLGIVACAHWPPASLGLVRYLVGMSFIRAAFPGSCWDLQFATSSQEKRRLHEGKLSRASRLASGEQPAVTLGDFGPRLGLAVDRFCAMSSSVVGLLRWREVVLQLPTFVN